MDNADHIPTLARNAVFIADRRPDPFAGIIANHATKGGAR